MTLEAQTMKDKFSLTSLKLDGDYIVAVNEVRIGEFDHWEKDGTLVMFVESDFLKFKEQIIKLFPNCEKVEIVS